MRVILLLLVCSSALLAQADSIITKTEVYSGKIVYAMFYSIFFQNDTCNQMAIPTEKVERLVLGNGEVIIGPGVPNRRYYKYLDTFDSFPSGTPDTLRTSLPVPGTRSVMANRLEIPPEDIQEESPDVVDIDGNMYRTIKIGSQTWMAENLRVTQYRDGTAIPLLRDGKDWIQAQTGARTLYDNQDIYGMLYNWYAVNDPRGLAPEGWHIPTEAEWVILEESLGMNPFETQQTGSFRGDGVGCKLSGGGERWEQGVLTDDPQFASSEFTALPGGYRGYLNGTLGGWGKSAVFWSSTATNAGSVWYRSLNCNNSGIYRDKASKQAGLAIRCIKDLPGEVGKVVPSHKSEGNLENYAPEVVSQIMNTDLKRGMTSEMTRLLLGEPERINRTEYDFTVYERWVYPQGRCLYFRSGVLQSWDDEDN